MEISATSRSRSHLPNIILGLGKAKTWICIAQTPALAPTMLLAPEPQTSAPSPPPLDAETKEVQNFTVKGTETSLFSDVLPESNSLQEQTSIASEARKASSFHLGPPP
ncbi:hypothetical protein Cantr_05716 [Candida viswanathii]|uniref:Uncharacterized protein n=1 Tax=Candida viswanathii TaxID=5486 RepID=A0A367XSQ5_9ASCO|nr:hypothetical protein Cantr_05716 [Candida viswanathii]